MQDRKAQEEVLMSYNINETCKKKGW